MTHRTINEWLSEANVASKTNKDVFTRMEICLAQKCEELHKALKNLMDEVCCECGNGYWSQGTCSMNGCMYAKNVGELLGKHPVIEQPMITFTNTAGDCS